MAALLLALAPATALADTPDLRSYLRARAAEQGGTGAAAYQVALAAAPDNPVVAVRAYRAALRDGDLPLATRAAEVLRRAGVAPADAALLPLAEAARAGDRVAAEAAAQRLKGTPLAILVPALEVWLARMTGVEPHSATVGDSVARRLASEASALSLLDGGRVEEGIAQLRSFGGPAAPLDLRIAAAQALMAAGRADAARPLLGKGNAVTERLLTPAAGRRPNPAFGVSRLFIRVAADLAVDDAGPVVITLAQAALVAEPGNARAALVLADVLSRTGAPEQALAALDGIAPADPFAPAADAARVDVLAAAGRDAEALTAAQRLAEAPGAGAAGWQRLAQLQARAGRWAEAAPLYARITSAAEGRGDWAAWMQYGEALERAGRWPEARTALQRAAALGPEEPLALNYLGYARADHGEAIAESQRLLERASRLRPDDTSIADSLGWAYHLGGNTRRGLPLIERAAADQPGNAEIAEHLGDAYWAVGRRYEARYAWSSAAAVADADGQARLARKVANGAGKSGR